MNRNMSIKLPNKTAPNFAQNTGATSFVNVPKALSNLPQTMNTAAQNAITSVNTAANSMFKSANMAATNAANSIGSLFAESTAPINESIQGSMESSVSPFLTIPMVVMLGVLIVMLIIVIKFKHQIILASELALRKIEAWWNEMFPREGAPPAAPPAILPPPNVDAGAINRMMPSHHKEVFHVGDNKYRYDEAAPLCESLGAQLATYDDVKKALNHGADWCSPGWVKGQQAVFPTQESTFQKLQEGPEDQRNACGTRPGIQGGFYDNPDLRFGVTCIGKKPEQSDTDRRASSKQQNLTPDALTYQKEVNHFKQISNEIPIAPFNSISWNK